MLLGIAASVFNYSVLKKEFSLGNIYGNQGLEINLLDLHSQNFLGRLKNKFYQINSKGLPVRDFFIPEKSIEFLNQRLPHNIKTEQKAFFKYPDGDYKKINIRYRGDNYFNWAYDRKNFRVELKKSKLVNETREFNYSMLLNEDSFSGYIPYFLGSIINLPTPKASLIELKVNGFSQGPFMEYQHLDETFLRTSGFMPVNLYKGEQFHTGRDREKGIELFNNYALWTKGATFNQRDKGDHSDLNHLIQNLINADSSINSYHLLKELVDIDSWAKFDALQTLIQSEHNDDEHNMRIISDVWRGKVFPIVYEMNMSLDPSREIIFEESKNSLFKVLHRSSEFLDYKYKYLYEYLSKGILKEAFEHSQSLIPGLSSSWKRDPALHQLSVTGRWQNGYGLKEMKLKWKNFSNNLLLREVALFKILNNAPVSTWNYNSRILSLSVNGVVPLKNPIFSIKPIDGLITPKIYFDMDGDNKISPNDYPIPFLINNDELTLYASFFANRISYKQDYLDFLTHEITNTSFNLISNIDLDILTASSNQFFTNKPFTINSSTNLGLSPNHLNYPVVHQKDKTEVWSGKILVNEHLEINNKIKILPGTKIYLGSKASIIFKNHVEAIGTKDSKISFIPFEEEIWGTIALLGDKTSRSEFDYIVMEGGSGHELEHIKFTGMFSIHNTNNISLNNMSFSNNNFYDDLIHIVYSKNILLKNCMINNALSDAIDVDISQVAIEYCAINNSGNDGVDSMTSIVRITDSTITNSGDKAVSVGENSRVLIHNSTLADNIIGVEAKDLSIADIYQTKFKNNNLDVNAYQKNWQYGGGGTIRSLDRSIEFNPQKLKTDKKSLIYLYGQYDISLFKSIKNNIFTFDNQSTYFTQNKAEEILQNWQKSDPL
jgi:hypothetical protein